MTKLQFLKKRLKEQDKYIGEIDFENPTDRQTEVLKSASDVWSYLYDEVGKENMKLHNEYLKNKLDFIKEAKKRGYRYGTKIFYDGMSPGCEILGDGEFEIKNGNVIKYEENNTDSSWRRFYTVYTPKKGWIEIIN